MAATKITDVTGIRITAETRAVLAFFQAHPRQDFSPQEVAAAAGVGAPYQLLRRLRKAGCIEQFGDTRDSRLRVYRLTKQGAETDLQPKSSVRHLYKYAKPIMETLLGNDYLPADHYLSQIARATGINLGYVFKTLELLEENKLVESEMVHGHAAGPGSRRRLYRLTDHGVKTATKIRAAGETPPHAAKPRVSSTDDWDDWIGIPV